MRGYSECDAKVYTEGKDAVAGQDNPALPLGAHENVPGLHSCGGLQLRLVVRAVLAVMARLALGAGLTEGLAPPAVARAAREVPLGAAPQPFFSASRAMLPAKAGR